MKNLCLKVLMLFLCTLISGYASSSNVWVYNQEISKVQVLSTGNFVIHLSSAADSVCQGGGKFFHVYVDQNTVTSDGAKALLSSALAALAAGKNIDIRYENSNSSCYSRELILNR